MSHAVYQFLMDLDLAQLEADHKGHGAAETLEQCILQDAIDRFEENFGGRLDDNNWWKAMLLRLNDRPAIIAEGIEDNRSAHELLAEQSEVEALFATAIAETWLYNAAEFVLEAAIVKPDTLPITNQPEVRKEFMTRMALQLEAYEAKELTPVKDSDKSYAKWLKGRIKRAITYARGSKVGGFTTAKRATAYDWRCFDLRADRKAAPNAILYLDVHT